MGNVVLLPQKEYAKRYDVFLSTETADSCPPELATIPHKQLALFGKE